MVLEKRQKRHKKRWIYHLSILTLLFTLLIGGCNDSDNNDNDSVEETGVVFSGVEVPTTDEAKRSIQASSSITIDGESHDIGFHTLMRSGDLIGGNTFGLISDENGTPVVETDASQFISSDTDFTSLIKKGDRLFSITHFESRPGAMYLTELDQNTATGELTPVSTRNIDFAAFGGLWVPCAGSVTPWNSHLGSEEYPPDARKVEEAQTPDDIDDYFKPMLRYFGVTDPFDSDVTIEQIKNTFHPYLYGYPTEVSLDDNGTPTVSKHFAMGRVAVELAYVMPDRKTVYISDDGTNVGFFMFIADTPGDLTAGTLYAAQWIQTGEENGGSADIEWINLGHATQGDIKGMINGGIGFSDIFETADPGDSESCGEVYISINTEDAGHECLKVKPGMELAASRLETRRYAAMMGATTEFRKEEGITFDEVNNKLYVAMSEVSRGMEDFKKYGSDNDAYDKGGANDVQLPYNSCGCVYGLEVGTDTTIGSDYVVKNMNGVITGTITEYAADSPYVGNSCDVEGIANPDNLTFINGKDVLIIGEDTGSGHQNDAIWAYNITTKELTRIETTPYGSETTSPYYHANINGWAYIMSVIQHPYGESDSDKLVDASDANAYVGYIGPIPAMDEATQPAAMVTPAIAFENIPVPVTDEEKREVVTSSYVNIDGVSSDIGYNTIFRSGDVVGGNTFGQIYDEDGSIVVATDGSPFVSSDNDFSSLLPINDRLFNVSHFESRPGAMYLTELQQNTDGTLTPISTKNIDFSAWGGLWVPCAGSVTPWGTHLGSEEYPPNARAIEEAETTDDIDDYLKPMLRYFGITDPFADTVTLEDIRTNFKPYLYGYPVEVGVAGDGNAQVTKHYAMGRVAVELAYVMPDNKTVYISDDGTNVGFFMFIADTPGDLSAGTLYAAKWIQTSTINGGSADLEWINLGHADQSQIQSAMDTGIVFSDMFETTDASEDATCPAGFTTINTTDGRECIRLIPGMETIASRVETRRYAALMGATTEFRKEEGITFDPDNNRLYVAMSEVTQGMEDFKKNGSDNDTYDVGGNNDVALPYNKCGCVYGLDVGTDTDMGSDYVAKTMNGVISGKMKTYPEDSPYTGNTCDVNGISNPDNITFITGKGTLIIGEDTGSGHQNDAIWSYNIQSGDLTRIETTPYGSETTSPYFYPDINGWSYIMSVIQHPYGESDSDKISDASDAAAYTGYIGPMPAMD